MVQFVSRSGAAALPAAAAFTLAIAISLALPAPTFARPAAVCGAAIAAPPQARERLKRFLTRIGIREVHSTTGTLWAVHSTGRLPRCYLTKSEARRRGWRPGWNLWRVALGYSIGGNRFGNRERRLPRGYQYVEADLDYQGGRRGARRLVFARSTKGRWRMWITVDHYRTFHRVPGGKRW